MRRGENPSDVLTSVKAAVDDLNKDRLPPGVRVKSYLRPYGSRKQYAAYRVAHAAGGTPDRGAGAVSAPRQHPRSAADGDHHPVVPAVRVHLHALLRNPGDLLSLGALDFGIIVDATLVMVEHVVHTLHERQGRPGFMENGGVLSADRDAALEVERPSSFRY